MVQRAFVVDMAPAGARATALLGAFHTAIGLAALPGGYLAGLLWDTFRPEATFLYGLVLTVIALMLLLCVKLTDEPLAVYYIDFFRNQSIFTL